MNDPNQKSKPPFFKSWGCLYAVALAFLVVNILFLYGITVFFTRVLP